MTVPFKETKKKEAFLISEESHVGERGHSARDFCRTGWLVRR